MPLLDLTALVFFFVCWLFYEPLLKASFRGGLINTDMAVVRAGWMRAMTRRTEGRIMDGQLLGHAINSASFFASSNLLLIAAVAGALFGGEATFAAVSKLETITTSSRMLFEWQLALVMITLARGLLAFIWAIRQLNYCVAVIGAAPEGEDVDPRVREAYAQAATAVLNPALSSFNAGVRGYYFSLAGACWLFGAPALIAATAGAVALLAWRQRRSRAAEAIRRLRSLLDSEA
ncbi:MAG TPA: DUF599 family protein [Caulobacteraceae bacterium]|nr:DUF599 family protein [Caulobacteraceae bacterium]